MATDIRAQMRFVDISAQKARLVVNLVRGKDVIEAANTLRFMPNKAARHISKLLGSAVANAEENFGVQIDDTELTADTFDSLLELADIIEQRQKQ